VVRARGRPSPEDTERIADAKRVIYEGLEKALEKGAEPSVTGALVDEQFGEPSGIPQRREGARAQARDAG
jgi:5-dehydro-2-deoxygluconokinase